MTRADYVRVKAMGEAAEKADAVRREKQERTEFLRHQKERFRKRGADLREERFQTEERIADAIEEQRQQAQAVGDNFRSKQEMLRHKRVVQDKEYEKMGRMLTEKYSTRDNQEKVRSLKAELVDENTRVATEMKTSLKKLKKQTDDNIMEVNTDRCRRVYQDTAHDVIRFSKQQIVANRWDRADDVRDHVALWKEEAKARDEEYVERARRIRDEVVDKQESLRAAARRQEDRVAYARQQTQLRKEMKAERDLVADSVLEQNRTVHDTIEESHLIPAEEVANSVTGGKETLTKLSRFFDFRRMAWATNIEQSPRRAMVRV